MGEKQLQEAHRGYQFFSPENFAGMTLNIPTVQQQTREAFMIHTPNLLEDLSTAVNQGAAQPVAKLLHRLKGSASMFCTPAFKKHIGTLEHTADAIDRLYYKESVQQLIQDVKTLLEEIKSFQI